MATVTQNANYGRTTIARWDLTNIDGTGDAINSPGNADRTVQVAGTFGGASVTIQGSCQNPPTDWATLHDPSGADLVFTSAGIRTVLECPPFIRAILTGGAASTVNVNMASRSN